MINSPAHLVILNQFMSATGGSEWRSLVLYEVLSKCAPVRLWTEFEAHPDFSSYPIEKIDSNHQQFPADGVLVIVGVYFDIGNWLQTARPLRTIIVINTFSSDRLLRLLIILKQHGFHHVEFVYTSYWLMQEVGLAGTIQYSPLNLEHFKVAASVTDRPFTVGRLSRDVPEKHHPSDILLYQTLAQRGIRVRIMGGTCLAEQLGSVPGVELLPEGAEATGDFLHTLDCFFYRTSEQWKEAFGRVVVEAMACGLPVVCYRHGGYREVIADRKTGYLFDSDEEALSLIVTLSQSKELCTTIGSAARESIQALYSPNKLQQLGSFYLKPLNESQAFDLNRIKLNTRLRV